jgi:hypothetical protein
MRDQVCSDATSAAGTDFGDDGRASRRSHLVCDETCNCINAASSCEARDKVELVGSADSIAYRYNEEER